MSKKYRHHRPKQAFLSRKIPWLWVVIGSAVLLVIGGLSALWTSSTAQPAVTPVVNGAPKLTVDQTVVDEGYLSYNMPVLTAFRLKNVGDQPLQILGEPRVELVEGC